MCNFNYNDVLLIDKDKIEQQKKQLKSDEFRIVIEQARYPLGNLNQIFESHILSPKYQRGRVWDNKRKSKLIESFLINIPVPPIFLYEYEFSQYEVMDGQQRVSTILEFFNDEFKLEGLEFFSDLNGKSYSDLSENNQSSIKRRYLSATILLKETTKEKTEESLMKQLVFERLNTGGMELNKQEIRNALYPGKFNDLLLELSNNERFNSLWSFKDEEKIRMIDCELILRFFAYKSAVHNKIANSIQSILDSYMMIGTSFGDEEIAILKELFEETIDRVYAIFGVDAFKSNPANNKSEKMIYDTVMLFVAEHLESFNDTNLDSLNEQKYALIEEHSEDFNGKYTSLKNVKERVEIMENLIEQV